MIALSPSEKIIMEGVAKYHGTGGTLHLTNKKLAFTYEKRGIIFKGGYAPLNLPLEKISGVAIIGAGPFKKISVNLIKEIRFQKRNLSPLLIKILFQIRSIIKKYMICLTSGRI